MQQSIVMMRAAVTALVVVACVAAVCQSAAISKSKRYRDERSDAATRWLNAARLGMNYRQISPAAKHAGIMPPLRRRTVGPIILYIRIYQLLVIPTPGGSRCVGRVISWVCHSCVRVSALGK